MINILKYIYIYIVINNNNLSIRKTPLDSNIVPYTYGTHMLLDMCILRKKYDNFIMLVKFHKNQDCDYDFMEDKRKDFYFLLMFL